MTTLKDILAEVEKEFNEKLVIVSSLSLDKEVHQRDYVIWDFIHQAIIRACEEMVRVQNNFLEGV